MELNIEKLRRWIGREEKRNELVKKQMVERFNENFDNEGDKEKDDVEKIMIKI